MADTQAHPDGGSRDAGPLREGQFYICPTCFNDYEERDITPDTIKRFEQADRLRQQNAELREALQAMVDVIKLATGGPVTILVTADRARAALARCQP